MDFILNKVLKTSVNWLFPPQCLVCNGTLTNDHYPCCTNCYTQLPFRPHSCQQCGQAFAANTDYCGRCIAKPPTFDACFCPFQYQEPISEHVQQFKYGQRPTLAKPLAQLMAREIDLNGLPMPEVLIPTPMHISRLRERGFNQSVEVAKALGHILGIPLAQNLIEKHRKTLPQTGLSFIKRSNNLAGSFRMRECTEIKTAAIVDDVVTTGATAEEIAKILKRNGVEYIQIWGVSHSV